MLEDSEWREQAHKYAFDLEDQPQVKTFFFNEKEIFEDREWENKTRKHAFDLKDQHPKPRPSLSTRRKYLKILGEENKHTKCALNLED